MPLHRCIEPFLMGRSILVLAELRMANMMLRYMTRKILLSPFSGFQKLHANLFPRVPSSGMSLDLLDGTFQLFVRSPRQVSTKMGLKVPRIRSCVASRMIVITHLDDSCGRILSLIPSNIHLFCLDPGVPSFQCFLYLFDLHILGKSHLCPSCYQSIRLNMRFTSPLCLSSISP